MQSHLSRRAFAVAILFAVASLPAQTIPINATDPGKIFDGVGAISGGGGNSRLLIDYPEPARSQILDYLFKPNYGAGLQILKVEIGADMDSTDGSESSHQHTRADENYFRGYEWWLMEQARARNPNIKFIALAWGAPRWVGDGNYWSRDMIDYIIRWLQHAQSDHHLNVVYLGGRNEHGYNIQWYKDLRAALRANGLAQVQVIASDDWPKQSLWKIAADMRADPALNDAIDIVGAHGPSWGGMPTPDAIALGKPLWDSEAHFDEKPPYNEVARNVIRNYAAGRLTASIYWPIVSAIYDNLPYDNIGFIKANQPWSGNYTVTPSLWVIAHTAQFAQPGWQYLDPACGFFESDATGRHGSYVTLRSPDSQDFSTIIETVQAAAPETAHFHISGFPPKPLRVWSTDLASADPSTWFVLQSTHFTLDGDLTLDLLPGHVYTLTTTTGQHKGAAVSPPAAPFPLPYADDFNAYAPGKLARYFADMVGSFETARCTGRSGICLAQVVPAEPTTWKRTRNRPFTILGSLDWTDYRISTDVLLQQPGSVDLIGRLTGMSGADIPNAYVLRVADTGVWTLLKTATQKDVETPLATGTVKPLGLNRWHHLTLAFEGPRITATIDRNRTILFPSDDTYPRGMAGLGTLGYIYAQFDNFKIESLTQK